MENLASAYWMHISLVICVLLMLKAKCLDVCSINESKQVNITYLEIALSKGAVCLDGSPPAYHFDKGSDDGINNWIVHLEGMMNATNAILAGSSAGGLATILNCDDFRAMVPNAKRVKCISDAGYFIHAKDAPGLKKREDRFAGVVSLHKLNKILPKSCTSKRNPGLVRVVTGT
ncbi:Pectin acetylesterase 8 [Abeliophyllum distichum]|uniref:Pectin acetylesterase n=1 Tax=Abeliophyllum distichum TaxID=126358 RepID=A0ABD1NW39_9LAMI